VPSSPPCPRGTSSSDPVHVVIRGRRSQWEPRGVVTGRTTGAGSTCLVAPGVGGMHGGRRSDGGLAEASHSDSFPSSRCCSELLYCLPWQAAAGRGPSAAVCATCWGTFRAIRSLRCSLTGDPFSFYPGCDLYGCCCVKSNRSVSRVVSRAHRTGVAQLCGVCLKHRYG